jgi:hypothetical protein
MNNEQQQHKQRIPKLTKKARTGRLDPASLAAALRWNQVAEDSPTDDQPETGQKPDTPTTTPQKGA